MKVVRHRSSRGPSAARNAGIAVTTGDWIFFHDDDDLMHRSHLADLLAATLDAPPNSLVARRSRDFAVVGDEVVLGPPVWTAADRSDTDTLLQFLDPNGRGPETEIGRQAAAGRTRATMASRARR